MDWLLYSLITALAVSARDVSVKIFRQNSPLEIAGMELFWSLPILILGFILVEVPDIDRVFWINFVLSIPLNAAAYILYLYAIKMSPLSLTVPFLAFTPAFMIITGKVVLDEDISLWGGAGIMLIVVGSYVLNISSTMGGISQPFRRFIDEKGAWIMLTVAFIFSFAAVIGKEAMIHSSTLFFSFSFFIVFNVCILFVLLLTGKIQTSLFIKEPTKGFWLGLLLSIHVACHGLAIAIANAAYMIALKRSSILFTVIVGITLLKEENPKWRGIGTALMFLGVLLISLKG